MIRTLALITAAGLCLAACASSDKSAAKKGEEKCLAPDQGIATGRTINTVCPVVNHGIPADAPTLSYKGHTIGFCCEDCIPEWKSWPEARKDEFVKKSLAKK